MYDPKGPNATNFAEVETVQDLKAWLDENMLTARLDEEGGEIIIRTGLIDEMGGVLHPAEIDRSYGELAELNHRKQVAIYNWCSCEEQEQFPYEDCPRPTNG